MNLPRSEFVIKDSNSLFLRTIVSAVVGSVLEVTLDVQVGLSNNVGLLGHHTSRLNGLCPSARFEAFLML